MHINFVLVVLMTLAATACGKNSSGPSDLAEAPGTGKLTPTSKSLEARTPLSAIYGNYETIEFNGKAVILRDQTKTIAAQCDTLTQIGNSNLSVLITNPVKQQSPVTAINEYFDVTTQAPLKSDSLWLRYGPTDNSGPCQELNFAVFTDQGLWTNRSGKTVYQFEGSVLTKDFKSNFVKRDESINLLIEKLANDDVKTQIELQFKDGAQSAQAFNGSFVLRKK